MQCPRDQADAANQALAKAHACKASVNHSESPGVFGRSSLAIRSRSPAMRLGGSHSTTQEVRYEHRGDF